MGREMGREITGTKVGKRLNPARDDVVCTYPTHRPCAPTTLESCYLQIDGQTILTPVLG
jgi:hypothetical protein